MKFDTSEVVCLISVFCCLCYNCRSVTLLVNSVTILRLKYDLRIMSSFTEWDSENHRQKEEHIQTCAGELLHIILFVSLSSISFSLLFVVVF